MHPDGTAPCRSRCANTADRDADEVVQLYIHQRYGTASRPVRELKGFQRITLAAGETRTVAVPARARRAALLERRHPRLGADASTFDVWVGGDSTAELSATFEVTAP